MDLNYMVTNDDQMTIELTLTHRTREHLCICAVPTCVYKYMFQRFNFFYFVKDEFFFSCRRVVKMSKRIDFASLRISNKMLVRRTNLRSCLCA